MTIAIVMVVFVAGMWAGAYLATRAGVFLAPERPPAVVRWAYYPPGAVPGVVHCSNQPAWADRP